MNYYEFGHCLMTVMTNWFYAPKGRHIVIKLPVLSVLSVSVFILYVEYISYIILGRNAKIRVLIILSYQGLRLSNLKVDTTKPSLVKMCLNAFRVMERHASLPLPSDLEKSCQEHTS